MAKTYITTAQASKILNVSERHILRLIHSRMFSSMQVGKQHRIDKESFGQYVQNVTTLRESKQPITADLSPRINPEEIFWIHNIGYPPSENEIYSDFVYKDKRGKARIRRNLNQKGQKYKNDISDYMNQSGLTTRLRSFVEKYETVDITIYLYRPNWYTKEHSISQTAGDAANGIKILQDTIFEVIGINDAHAFFSGARKLYAEEPKASVVITKSPPEEDFF